MPQGPIPYMTVKGAAEAINFYVAAFGAVEQFRLTDPGDGRIGHAELILCGGRFYLCDEYPGFGAISPDTLGGSPVKLQLEVADVDAFVAHALANGATQLRAARDEFYGQRTALMGCPFGYGWFVATALETVTPAEMQARWNRMAAG